MRTISLLLTASALVAGMPVVAARGDTARAERAAKAEAALAKAIDGRVAGAPVRCISLSGIRSSTVIEGTAILYDAGGTLYVNRPASGASSLDENDVLVTKTSGSQLCDLDVVRLMDRSTRFETGFVGLGRFVPYMKVKAAGAR